MASSPPRAWSPSSIKLSALGSADDFEDWAHVTAGSDDNSKRNAMLGTNKGSIFEVDLVGTYCIN